jgi:hypothetical protein
VERNWGVSPPKFTHAIPGEVSVVAGISVERGRPKEKVVVVRTEEMVKMPWNGAPIFDR